MMDARPLSPRCPLLVDDHPSMKSLYYPAAFLVLECVAFLLGPSIAHPAAYIVMVAAPLLTALTLVIRGLREDRVGRAAWVVFAASLCVWALGAIGNLWQEWILGHANEMYRGSMLGFHLAAVPIAFVLASEWRAAPRPLARVTDAVMAMALGYAFFLYTWAVLTARGAPDDAGVHSMIWLLDAQNVFLFVGALVRWFAATSRRERDFFRAVLVYESVYMVLVFVNNHYIAGDPSFGPEVGAFISIAFAVLAGLALLPPTLSLVPRRDPRLVRAVRSASPTMLAGALLIVSLFVIREDYLVGTVGILIAVIGYGLRTTLNQVVYIERGEILQRERSELQNIAWTDALTGLANRHFIDRKLYRKMEHEKPLGEMLSVLMIDIDHFKMLNDHYGHPAGDACLREVARALRDAIVRPNDVVARYGGEEFIVLVHDADAAGALVVAERLRLAVENLHIENVGSPFGVVTVSVGAASAPPNVTVSTEELVAAADRALYDAKRAGRNRIKSLVIKPGVEEDSA
jgi:diguanylate cyclase (GGDEF)-like protein